MKNKILIYSLIFIGSLFTHSCKKPYDNKKEELPSLLTKEVTDISTTEAFSGVDVVGDTSRIQIMGCCWDTVPNPTYTDNRIAWTHKQSSLIVLMRDLLHSTTYYVRAYAIVGSDTIYGDEKSFRTLDTYVGDNYLGGKVAYIFQPGDPGYIEGEIHGLVISPNNLLTHDKYNPSFITQVIAWDDELNNKETGAIGTGIGYGNPNTNSIVSVLGLGSYSNIDRFYAARLCYDLELNGYSDWYLPSIDELKNIMINYSGLQLNSEYWTSTEVTSSTALIYGVFDQPQTQEIAKGYITFVRAVRSF